MAKKLYIKLQTPVIELSIEAKDASGIQDTLLIGYKRFEITESKDKLEQCQKLILAEENDSSKVSDLNNFVKSNISYLKNVNLEISNDEDKLDKLSIDDTRLVLPNDTLWESADECLDVLLDAYLASFPWRVSLILGMQKALLNVDLSEDKTKN
jgi:hypothetical protein